MKQVMGLSLTTKTPVLLSAQPPSYNLLETLDYIPGNTVRGLLAQRYLQTDGKSDDSVFQSLFLNGKACFAPAYLDGLQVIPLSARTCKYDGGFPPGGHGVRDSLLQGGKDLRCKHINPKNTKECQAPMDYFTGYYDPSARKAGVVAQRLITRTAINPALGATASARLYSQRVIAEGQVFKGFIEVPPKLEKALEQLLATPFIAGVGTGRSRGQGWVEVAPASWEPPPWGKARERFGRYSEINKRPVLVVTLLSDAIFSDDYLRDRTAPLLRHLDPLRINREDWEEDKDKDKPPPSYATTRLVGGFDGKPWLLPRMPRLAVAAGSVFCFPAKTGTTSPTIPDGDGLGWIGDLNREGYGLALLWHPFHYDYGR
jgi:CRISPR-associated Csx10 family RAMP protein